MHYLFYMGHPAHFHLFKRTITALKNKNHRISILIKKKDVLEELLKGSDYDYKNILPEGRHDSRRGLAMGLIKRDFRLLRYCISYRPDLLIGTSVEIGHVGRLLNIPSLNVNEDDASVVPLYSKLSYPFCNYILSPSVCNNGKWEKKSVKYEGYHELAYLHPNHFVPSADIAKKYISKGKPYSLIRFAKLTAHHDNGIRGLSAEVTKKLIDVLLGSGDVYITSERMLEPEFEPFRISVNPSDIHHVMAFSNLYIGDSQTMAAEAGVLGTPFLRFNDFVGRIGYLNELEQKFNLGYGISPSEPELLLSKAREILQMADWKKIFQERRNKMLLEKIDVTAFMVWFIENFPESFSVMKKDPGFQSSFK